MRNIAKVMLILPILCASCVGVTKNRITVSQENWGIDGRFSPNGVPTYVFIEGREGQEWPRLDVETGRTPDNRPYVLITTPDS